MKPLERERRPVLIVGARRSGTTLLHHKLMSAGGFAILRSEVHAFNLSGPKLGGLRFGREREALAEDGNVSASGLEAKRIRSRIIERCDSAGAFLRTLMESTCDQQRARRSADSAPENALHLAQIRRELPAALIVHVIRDERDAALSLEKLGWIRRLPWDRNRGAFAADVFWDWAVGRARRDGRLFGSDYAEIRSNWTRLSCYRFRANDVRLQIAMLACNVGNLWRRLGLPHWIKGWSLTNLQRRLMKTGGRLVNHARYNWFLLAESHPNRKLFGEMLGRIGALPVPGG